MTRVLALVVGLAVTLSALLHITAPVAQAALRPLHDQPQQPSQPEPPKDTVQGRFTDGAAVIGAERLLEATGPATAGVGHDGDTPPQYSYAKIPACPGNNIVAGDVDPCPGALTACDEPGVLQWWLYRAPYRAGDPLTIGEAGWERTGTLCATPEAAGTDPVVPAYSSAEFQRLPLPAGTSTVEPPGDYVLVRMPTNVFATATEPVLLDTVLAGIAIQVRATPARWSWDFGDGEGSIGPTDEPGAAYPALTHTHAYAGRGTYDITMTTHYTGEYTIDGETWLPIPGEAEVDSAPTTVQALAGRNVLVADP